MLTTSSRGRRSAFRTASLLGTAAIVLTVSMIAAPADTAHGVSPHPVVQLPSKHVLTLEAAKRVADAAEAEADRNGWAVSIAVLDDSGQGGRTSNARWPGQRLCKGSGGCSRPSRASSSTASSSTSSSTTIVASTTTPSVALLPSSSEVAANEWPISASRSTPVGDGWSCTPVAVEPVENRLPLIGSVVSFR